MPSTSKDNKGLIAGKHSKHTKESHKIQWHKVKHGAPKRKMSTDTRYPV